MKDFSVHIEGPSMNLEEDELDDLFGGEIPENLTAEDIAQAIREYGTYRVIRDFAFDVDLGIYINGHVKV